MVIRPAFVTLSVIWPSVKKSLLTPGVWRMLGWPTLQWSSSLDARTFQLLQLEILNGLSFNGLEFWLRTAVNGLWTTNCTFDTALYSTTWNTFNLFASVQPHFSPASSSLKTSGLCEVRWVACRKPVERAYLTEASAWPRTACRSLISFTFYVLLLNTALYSIALRISLKH